MSLYLPIAEMSVHAEVILGLGLMVGFFSGLFGVGGGFMGTPLLVMLGVPPVVAVATQTCQIIASSSAGVIVQAQRRRVDFKLAGIMLMGGTAGSVVGMIIFGILKALGQIDLVIALLYFILLGTIGILMCREALNSLLKRKKSQTPAKPFDNRYHRWLKVLPYPVHFPHAGITISVAGPLAIGFLSGILVATMGIGAGFLIVPAMIYILGVPALMVTGTSLFQILCISALTALLHAMTTHAIDLVLAAPLVLGSVIGAVLGLRASQYIKGPWARLALASLILMVALYMGSTLLGTPATPYSLTVRAA